MAKAKRISNQERKATQVALAVAEEVVNNKMAGHKFLSPNFGIRPEMLNRPIFESDGSIGFHFVGGINVNVFMFDMGTLAESWRGKSQDWVVYQVRIRYRINEEVKMDTKYAPWLAQLRQHRPWHHPRPLAVSKICGRIGIFWDNGASRGHTEADPDYNQDGFSVLVDEVPYMVLVPGDKEKAKAEADKVLASYYKKEVE